MAGRLTLFSGANRPRVDDGGWWDVPKGATTGASSPTATSSKLDLLLEGTRIFKGTGSGGSVGGSTWNRIVTTNPPRARVRLSGFSGEGATGVWLGNDGGVYYVRQSGTELVWFGQACSGGARPTFANVFKGTRAGTSVTGVWADVPYGSTLGSGLLGLTVVDANRITRSNVSGGFGGTSWTRSSAVGGIVASALQVTIGTGADDLRGGAVAYGIVELSGGRTLPKVNLNNGAGWSANSTNVVTVPLPVGTTVNDVVTFIIEHDGAPRNVGETYDNWSLDAVQIAARSNTGSLCLGSQSWPRGSEALMLTGERTYVAMPIDIP